MSSENIFFHQLVNMRSKFTMINILCRKHEQNSMCTNTALCRALTQVYLTGPVLSEHSTLTKVTGSPTVGSTHFVRYHGGQKCVERTLSNPVAMACTSNPMSKACSGRLSAV